MYVAPEKHKKRNIIDNVGVLSPEVLRGCPKVPAGSSTSIVLVVLLRQSILMKPGLSGWFTQGKCQSLRNLSRSLEAEQSSGEHQGVLRGAEESKDGWVPFQKEGRVPDSCHG